MRILVFGAGAIGSLFGGLLSRSHDVHLVGRRPHADAIRRNGLRIESPDGRSVFHPAASAGIPPGGSWDLLAVAVKAHQLEEACETLSRLGPPPRAVACLQNGIGNEEILSRHYSPESVIRAVIYEGALKEEPGLVRWAGRGITFIGAPLVEPRDTRGEMLGELAAAWSRDRFTTRVSKDIRREIWRKLIVNAAINPVGAVAGVTNGELLRSPELRQMLRALVRECEKVAVAEEGYAFDLTDKVEEIAERTGENRNSMLLDLESGRRTEIGFLNERIVRYADRHRLPVPENRNLVETIRGREREMGLD